MLQRRMDGLRSGPCLMWKQMSPGHSWPKPSLSWSAGKICPYLVQFRSWECQGVKPTVGTSGVPGKDNQLCLSSFFGLRGSPLDPTRQWLQVPMPISDQFNQNVCETGDTQELIFVKFPSQGCCQHIHKSIGGTKPGFWLPRGVCAVTVEPEVRLSIGIESKCQVYLKVLLIYLKLGSVKNPLGIVYSHIWMGFCFLRTKPYTFFHYQRCPVT